MIALGSDHGGYDLKMEVIRYLEENNIEYKDFAWVDFAEYENITEFKKEFGNQYYISDDVTIENGVLNIPEGATFAWIDANGVFANFLDNSNLGFNVEMMVKTDFVGDGFIRLFMTLINREWLICARTIIKPFSTHLKEA